MSNTMKIAVAQLNSNENTQENLEKTEALIEDAVKNKTEFFLLPEVFNFRKTGAISPLKPENINGKSITLLRSLSKKHKLNILAGSICEQIEGSKKVYNTSVLIDLNGNINAIYRKIHLFDIDSPDTKIKESKWYDAGTKPVIGLINGRKVGLSICYDIRFPELYRLYAKEKVEIVTIPSSFTSITGQAHWEVLCRARAIENQAYVLAPNQVGIGAAGIQTFGNSLIIDPWGKVLQKGSSENHDLLFQTIDFDKLEKIRQEMPVLSHNKL